MTFRKHTQLQPVNKGFRVIDRGFRETLLLVPGWATDYRIFEPLDLDFNYLVPAEFSLPGFEEMLLESLKKESPEGVSILGWSMGGFLAAGFAAKYPQLVKSLTLAGMRRSYDREGIEKVKGYIISNKDGYLYKFYHQCFSPAEKKKRALFKKGLMKEYFKNFTTEELLSGLDYLGGAVLDEKALNNVGARFIHGSDDAIAPVEGLSGIGNVAILNGAGHVPFLRSDFREVFYGR